MSESNGTTVGTNGTDAGKVTNRLPKGKAKTAKGTIGGYMERARDRATKKSITFKGKNDEGEVGMTVKSFPGLTADDVTLAASGGVTISGKLNNKLEGKTVTFKEDGKGDEGQSMAEEFFGIDTNDE